MSDTVTTKVDPGLCRELARKCGDSDLLFKSEIRDIAAQLTAAADEHDKYVQERGDCMALLAEVDRLNAQVAEQSSALDPLDPTSDLTLEQLDGMEMWNRDVMLDERHRAVGAMLVGRAVAEIRRRRAVDRLSVSSPGSDKSDLTDHELLRWLQSVPVCRYEPHDMQRMAHEIRRRRAHSMLTLDGVRAVVRTVCLEVLMFDESIEAGQIELIATRIADKLAARDGAK